MFPALSTDMVPRTAANTMARPSISGSITEQEKEIGTFDDVTGCYTTPKAAYLWISRYMISCCLSHCLSSVLLLAVENIPNSCMLKFTEGDTEAHAEAHGGIRIDLSHRVDCNSLSMPSDCFLNSLPLSATTYFRPIPPPSFSMSVLFQH